MESELARYSEMVVRTQVRSLNWSGQRRAVWGDPQTHILSSVPPWL